jgi:hypothetical protein
MTEERADRPRCVVDATSENTKAKPLDAGETHSLADLANKEQMADDLSADLSAPWLPVERQTRVDRSQ